jgi:hypothetical protein
VEAFLILIPHSPSLQTLAAAPPPARVTHLSIDVWRAPERHGVRATHHQSFSSRGDRFIEFMNALRRMGRICLAISTLSR